MKKGKNTQKVQEKTKIRKKDTLAKKEGESLKTITKDPLMNTEGDKTESKTEKDAGSILEETVIGEEELSVEVLKDQLDEKKKLAEEYYDKLLRAQAEFENYKKRTDKDLNEFRIYANAQLIKELLRVLDDFQTALASEEKSSDKKFIEGIGLIYKNFYGMLEKEGLNIINPVHEKFDPWKHEAVEMVPTNEHPEHTVLGVIQPGYRFKDKILRPAKVRVATLPASDEGKLEDEGEEYPETAEKKDKQDNTENNDKNKTEEKD
jgi:molecular chaperone GrpE